MGGAWSEQASMLKAAGNAKRRGLEWWGRLIGHSKCSLPDDFSTRMIRLRRCALATPDLCGGGGFNPADT